MSKENMNQLYEITCDLLKGFVIGSSDTRINPEYKVFQLPKELKNSFSLQYKLESTPKTVIKCKKINNNIMIGFRNDLQISIDTKIEFTANYTNGVPFMCFDVGSCSEDEIIAVVALFTKQLKITNYVQQNPDNNEFEVIDKNMLKFDLKNGFAKAKDESFDELVKIVFDGILQLSQTDRLIWPIYSPLSKNDEQSSVRISEQEVRQQFVKELSKKIKDKETGWCYSVETPSIDGYSFKNSKYPIIKHHDEGGQSARFDLSIYKSYNTNGNIYDLLSHIEFKQGNGDANEMTKDLLKLANEPFCPKISEAKRSMVAKHYGSELKSKTHYFIHLINSFGKDTLLSLTCKYFGLDKEYKFLKTEDYIEINNCLSNSENTIFIYLLIPNNKLIDGIPCIYRINYSNTFQQLINNDMQLDINKIWEIVKIIKDEE